ncbi:hypothetical protein [Kribbella ginsengisoli]|uniref:hypothetical protein n=1 Tax=Kribbella ginsengisoli TaxID=363865 RepID=UPI0031D7360C
MTSNEIEPPGHVEIWGRALVGMVPLVGGPAAEIWDGYRKRYEYRASQALGAIGEKVTPEQLQERLVESEDLDVVFGRAIQAAANSGLEAKRRLLGLVIAEAVLDDAMIDSASLMTDVLSQIEAPHVRCLEDIWRVQQEVESSGERSQAARGAEREINQRILDVGRKYPSPLLQTLVNLSLLDARTSWDQGMDLIQGLTTFGEDFLRELHGATGATDSSPSTPAGA